MAFKKGDVVEVVNKNMVIGGLKLGVKYTIEAYDPHRYSAHGGCVLLERKAGDGLGQNHFMGSRFKLAEPVVLKLEVGCEVLALRDIGIHLAHGNKAIVEKVYVDALGATTGIKLRGINARYHLRNFKVVAEAKEAFNRDAWNPQAGEKVFIVGESGIDHVGNMDKYINDGVEHTISGKQWDKDAYYVIHADGNRFYWSKDALRPVNAGKPAAKPVVPPPPPPPQDLREELWKRVQEYHGGLCSFGAENKAGRRVFHNSAPCHASMGYLNLPGEITKVVYCLRHDIQYQLKPYSVKADDHKAYVEYILNGSPWSVAFETKDFKEASTKDIYMNVEVNRNVLVGAMVAVRVGFEKMGRSKMFKKMLDAGHHPHTCFLLACRYTDDGLGGYRTIEWGGGHDVLDQNRKFDSLIKFFKEGYHEPEGTLKEPFRTHHGHYTIANACARGGGYAAGGLVKNSIGDWFAQNTKMEVFGEGFNKRTKFTDKSIEDVAKMLDDIFNNKQQEGAA